MSRPPFARDSTPYGPSSSSAYFQSTSQSQTSSSPSTVKSALQAQDVVRGRRPQYTPSVVSSRPSTSRASASRSGTRPSTASGHKSRTTTTSSILGLVEQQNIVCALGESCGVTPSVGVAFVSISLGEATLSQICDNQSYVKTIHKLQMLSPSRILFRSSVCPPNSPSTLFSLVQELVPEARCDALDRSAWSEHAGMDFIHKLAAPDDLEPVKFALQGKYYSTCSFAAVAAHSCPRVVFYPLLTSCVGHEISRASVYHQLCPSLSSHPVPAV